jgi:hypothetical protein
MKPKASGSDRGGIDPSRVGCRASFSPRRAWLLLGLMATVSANQGFAAAASTTETFENYVDVAAGGTLLSGDRDQFQKLRHEKKDGWGGIENFHFSRDFDKTTTLTADGRALAGNDDFRLDLKIAREDVGFVRAGLQQYRVWFDGSGGWFPAGNVFLHLYDEDLHIDRSDFWIEAGTTRPNALNFNFRYDFTERRGLKDSTSWGDTNLTAGLGTRSIVPTFLRIKEHRHIMRAKMGRESDQTSWQIDGRYERQAQDNSRNVRRQPLSAQDRDVTQRDDANVDLFMVHGAFETRLGPTLTLGSGVAHYDLDNTISGSRIYGDAYDPVFNATMARRQARDEGFFDLSGTTHLKQTLANLNVMYTPTETLAIIPELRAQRSTWGGGADYVETAVGTTAALLTAQDDMRSESDKNYRDLTEVLEARYTGVRNVALNAMAELMQSYGALTEDLIALETGVDTIFRTTDFRRDQQKYSLNANWYARPGLAWSAQYYWKGRQNSFSNTRTSTAPVGADRYPAYITHQDLATDDFNFRVSWSPTLQLRSVTRYDYQDTTLRSQEIGLAFVTSGHVRTHLLGETLTWNPLMRWYVQAAGNLVYDRTTSPAHDLTGAAAGIVLNSDNNYFNGDLATGYALDDRTDLTLSYSYYRAANFVDNSKVSQPYGAAARTQFVSFTWFRRVTPHLNYTVRYAYGDSRDDASGGNNNFRAHTVYGRVQCRF